jgi:hypothetical protein
MENWITTEICISIGIIASRLLCILLKFQKTVKSFEDQIFVLKPAVQEKSQWEQTVGQKKKQKKEQKEELIKQEIKEEENDEEIRVENFCNQMFPVLTAIRKKIRQFLKYRGFQK